MRNTQTYLNQQLHVILYTIFERLEALDAAFGEQLVFLRLVTAINDWEFHWCRGVLFDNEIFRSKDLLQSR